MQAYLPLVRVTIPAVHVCTPSHIHCRSGVVLYICPGPPCGAPFPALDYLLSTVLGKFVDKTCSSFSSSPLIRIHAIEGVAESVRVSGKCGQPSGPDVAKWASLPLAARRHAGPRTLPSDGLKLEPFIGPELAQTRRLLHLPLKVRPSNHPELGKP